MKKPGAGSTGKGGLGSIGKSGLGGGKSGITSTSKTSGIMGSSGKSSYSSTSKSLSPTSKSSISPTSKSSGGLIASPKPSKSFDFIPSSKTSSLTASPKSYPSSSSYNAYGTPKSGKSATLGIIWIPTGKRNKKKKDIVINSNNDDRRRERSPSFYKFMSGDSHDLPHKKKDEETDLLVVPERKIASGVIAATETAIAGNIAAPNLEDKQSLIKQDNEESKEAAGDSKDNEDTDDDKEYLSNDEPVRHKLPDTLSEKATYGDKVDSVYLRPPPPHKSRSNASTPDDDSCGIKCLYYTLQCCDCVLM